MPIKTLKKLEATFDGKHGECQCSTLRLEDTSTPSTLTSFCGEEQVPSPPSYQLAVTAWQDWGTTDSLCEIFHEAYLAYMDDPEAGEVPVVMTVGTVTRSFTVKMTQDIPFGGDAGGDGLTFSTTLSVSGDVVDGVAA